MSPPHGFMNHALFPRGSPDMSFIAPRHIGDLDH
jgi:hypothetical protein